MKFKIMKTMKCHWSPKRPARVETIFPESIRSLAAGKSSQEKQIQVFVIVKFVKLQDVFNFLFSIMQ